MYKAVLFDFDGTLADTRHLVYDAYIRLAGKHGLETVSPEEFEEMKTLSIRERFKKSGVSLRILPRLARDAMTVYGELIDSVIPFPGIPELLQTLKNRAMAVSIVSSNSYKNIDSFLTAHNLQLFDHIDAGSGIFGKHRAIKRSLRHLGTGRQEAVYVGDELRDINACRKVPLDIVSVSWGYDSLSLLEEGKPDYLVHEPAEILEILGSGLS